MRRPALTILYHFDPWSTGVGGIDTLIRSWVRHAPRELEVRVVGTGRDGDTHGRWRDAELCGRSIRFMSAFAMRDPNRKPRVPHTLRFAAAIARAGRALASDFVHFHRIEPSVVARRWPGRKTLFFHIDIEKQLRTRAAGNEFQWRRWPAAYLALERRLVSGFDEVLECNADSLRFHRERYPALSDRFRHVRNCVDTDVHAPLDPAARDRERRALAQRLGLAPQTRFVLFAARLQPMKDPLLLLRAFAALARPDVHLLVAGDGNLRDAMRAEIDALRLGARVSMLGALAQGPLAELHRVADAFVLTSTYEGLPVAALEALASGTPVVTTPAGDTPRLLSAGAGLVCDADASQIAAALAAVLDARERFPAAACIAAARPHAAGSVLGAEYTRMLAAWSGREPTGVAP